MGEGYIDIVSRRHEQVACRCQKEIFGTDPTKSLPTPPLDAKTFEGHPLGEPWGHWVSADETPRRALKHLAPCAHPAREFPALMNIIGLD